MSRFLVIADDLTGAAEIGGIAVSLGLSARIALGLPLHDRDVNSDVVIVDTNTRHLAPATAAAALAAIARQIPWAHFTHSYKKIDSALRGPVIAEVGALLRWGHWQRAVLIPQNPSRGRTILNGQYLIDGVPLHRTFVAFDPEHPADTADVLRRVGHHDEVPVSLVPPDAGLPERGIALCDAADLTVLQRRADAVDPQTLPVGGADFFRAMLRQQVKGTAIGGLTSQTGAILVVCGSASEQSRTESGKRAASGAVVVDFPLQLCESEPSEREQWARGVARYLKDAGTVWIAVGSDARDGWAPRIRTAMADAVVRICDGDPSVGQLLIEGGATGAAIASRAGWRSLTVESELAGGVVAVRPYGADGRPWRSATVVLKPGSYAWPIGVIPGSGRAS